MVDRIEKVTRTEENSDDPGGPLVEKQTRQVHTETSADTKTTAQNLVWYLLGLIEVLLAFRFVLKLFGANTASPFVEFIYGVSGVLSAPFDSIFGVSSAKAGETQSVFEPSILVAAVVYALIAWGIVKLITINQKD